MLITSLTDCRRVVFPLLDQIKPNKPLEIFGETAQCKNVQRPVQMQLRVKSGNGYDWVGPQVFSLLRRIEVFGFCITAEFILISRQAAEEDGAADGDDGGAPAKSVGPGVVIVTLKDQLIEFDWVDDQSDDLDNRNNDQECCYASHKTNVDVTHRHNGQNEGDDEDD